MEMLYGSIAWKYLISSYKLGYKTYGELIKYEGLYLIYYYYYHLFRADWFIQVLLEICNLINPLYPKQNGSFDQEEEKIEFMNT